MRVLIVESETYLAQSIATKLSDIGNVCEIVTTTKDAIKDENYDVVLLSNNISGQNFYPVINRYSNSIIIMLISYISNDTVTNPLKAGAKDYIVKPFMIDELIRKIDHFRDYERIKRENIILKDYIEFQISDYMIGDVPKKLDLPLLLKAKSQRCADTFAFKYAKLNGLTLEFVSLKDAKHLDKIASTNEKSLLYIVNFEDLKKVDKRDFLTKIEHKKLILSTLEESDELGINTIEVKNRNKFLDGGELISIDEYVKNAVINYQNKYPDTELSKKLGISRKSLWERRKKYGIAKKK